MMKRIFAAQGSLILGISLVQPVNGYMGTLVGIRVAAAEADALQTGIVTSAFFFGYAIGSVLCKGIIQRSGHIRAFAVFAATVAIGVLGLALYFHPALWTIFRLMMGFGCAGLFVATESWLNVKSMPETRGKVFSVYMVATYLTFGGSQFVLLLSAPEGRAAVPTGRNDPVPRAHPGRYHAQRAAHDHGNRAAASWRSVPRGADRGGRLPGCGHQQRRLLCADASVRPCPGAFRARDLLLYRTCDLRRHAAAGAGRQAVRSVRPPRGCRLLRARIRRSRCGDPLGARDHRARAIVAAAGRLHVRHLSGMRRARQ